MFLDAGYIMKDMYIWCGKLPEYGTRRRYRHHYVPSWWFFGRGRHYTTSYDERYLIEHHDGIDYKSCIKPNSSGCDNNTFTATDSFWKALSADVSVTTEN